jgi:hypothetical protein
VHNSYNKQSRDIGVCFLGVMVGELGRPIVGPPRSADRLKNLAHNSKQQQQKKPKPTTTTKMRYLSINQSMEQRKKERINGAALPRFSSVTLPHSQGVGIGDVGHRYVGTYNRGT